MNRSLRIVTLATILLLIHSELGLAKLKSNRSQVVAALEAKHDKVIWGNKIGHEEYLELMATIPAGPVAVGTYLSTLATKIATETGGNVAKQTIYDLLSKKKKSTIMDGKPLYIGIKSFNHRDVTKTPCLHVTAQHREGHDVKLPCLHYVRAHGPHKWHGIRYRCLHMVPEHDGHTNHIPCLHSRPAHDSHTQITKLPNTHQFYIAIGKKN